MYAETDHKSSRMRVTVSFTADGWGPGSITVFAARLTSADKEVDYTTCGHGGEVRHLAAFFPAGCGVRRHSRAATALHKCVHGAATVKGRGSVAVGTRVPVRPPRRVPGIPPAAAGRTEHGQRGSAADVRSRTHSASPDVASPTLTRSDGNRLVCARGCAWVGGCRVRGGNRYNQLQARFCNTFWTVYSASLSRAPSLGEVVTLPGDLMTAINPSVRMPCTSVHVR